METNYTILLSGGSRGLGLTLVSALLEDGHRVATFSRERTGNIDEFEKKYIDRFFFQCGDMATPSDLEVVVRSTEKKLGPIEVLINNAGLARDGVLPTMHPKDIETVVSVNLLGTLNLTRLVSRSMVVRQHGRIITISSIVGSRGYRGLAAYAATKAGLDGMTRALARELGAKNIRVNSIAPGFLETEMSKSLGDENLNQIVRRTPLGRLGTPDDVVGCLRFLISPASDFITGQTLIIDGGITC